MTVPDLTDYVIGFREWRFKEDMPGVGLLYPTNTNVVTEPWIKGVNVARCWATLGDGRLPCLPAPQVDCECGLYLKHTTEELGHQGGTVYGVVRAWGRIAVHETGFRAQYAEIIALMSNLEDEEETTTAAQVYDVPIISREDAEGFVEWVGGSIPHTLYPGGEDQEDRRVIPVMLSRREAFSRYLEGKSRVGIHDGTCERVLAVLSPLLPPTIQEIWDVYMGRIPTVRSAVQPPPMVTPDLSIPVSEAKRFLSPRGQIAWIPQKPMTGVL